MRLQNSRAWAFACVVLGQFLWTASPAAAQPSGQITGRLVREAGTGLGGVTVVLQETGASEITDADGHYRFQKVTAGTHTLLFVLGEHTASATLVVRAGETTAIETTVDWMLVFSERVTVRAPSRTLERAIEAPATTTVLSEAEIAQQSTHTQVPRLLAASPGLEVTQSDIYDFALNTRGFNTAGGRRLMTLIDGRDPSTPLLIGFQEWAAFGFPLDEIARAELIRGPAAALYGPGAFNGVLNLATKSPRDTLGTRLKLTVGELGMFRTDVRHAAALGGGWYYRALGAYERGRDFTRSRVASVEYEPQLLDRELVEPPKDGTDIVSGAVRFDKEFDDTELTIEGGLSHIEGPVYTVNTGRVQVTDLNRPWGRVNLRLPRWNALVFYTGRLSEQLSLATGQPGYTDEIQVGVDLQHNRNFARGKGRAVAGASVARQRVDSSDPSGRHTLFDRVATARQTAAFGQIDWHFTRSLKGSFSARLDEGTLFDATFSPRMALIYTATPRHTLRVNYSTAFLGPTLVTAYLRTDIAPPVDLSPLEAALAPLLAGVRLGFESIPILAVGNERLPVEQVRAVEGSYTGVIGTKLLVDVHYYRHSLKDFTTNLLPQVGTALGRLNQAYQPYAPPSQLSPAAATAVRAALEAVLPRDLLPFLSNDGDGKPVFAFLSLGSFGQAKVDAVETNISWFPATGWKLDGAYTIFHSNLSDEAQANGLRTNTPKHSLAGAVSYKRDPLSVLARLRWVDSIDWWSGVYRGPVPAYLVIDLSATYALDRRWSIGIDISNVLDDDHYELFGGSLIGRRALIGLTYSR